MIIFFILYYTKKRIASDKFHLQDGQKEEKPRLEAGQAM